MQEAGQSEAGGLQGGGQDQHAVDVALADREGCQQGAEGAGEKLDRAALLGGAAGGVGTSTVIGTRNGPATKAAAPARPVMAMNSQAGACTA